MFDGVIPSSLIVPGDHLIKMVVEDNGDPVEQVIEERLITVKKKGGGGGGSIDQFMLLLLMMTLFGSAYQRRIKW